MREETVGDLARHFGHARTEAAQIDRRRAERVRARVERGDHQRVAVELALEAQLGLAFEAIEDRAHRQHELAHARRRSRPRHEKRFSMCGRTCEPSPRSKPPAADRLQPVREVREVHRIARERDGDRGAELQRAGVLGGEHQRQERVVLRLEAEGAVVADPFELREERARLARIFERRGRVDLHASSPLRLRAHEPAFVAARRAGGGLVRNVLGGRRSAASRRELGGRLRIVSAESPARAWLSVFTADFSERMAGSGGGAFGQNNPQAPRHLRREAATPAAEDVLDERPAPARPHLDPSQQAPTRTARRSRARRAVRAARALRSRRSPRRAARA